MNLNQVKIYFYVRPSTVKNKRGCLNVRVTVNNKQIVCAAKSLSMYPEEFDSKTQNPKKKCDLYFEATTFMVGMRQEINKIHNDYEKKKHVFTKEHLERAVEDVYHRVKHGRNIKEKTFLDMYDEFLANEEKVVGKLVSKGTHSVRTRYKKVITASLEELKLKGMPICNFSEQNVRDVQYSLLEKYASGTASRVHSMFSAIFAYALKKKHISENPCLAVEHIKYSKRTNLIWLEHEEVLRVMEVQVEGNVKKYRDAFIFCCFTGLSIGDYMLLNPKKCDELVASAQSPKDIQPGKIVSTKSGEFLVGSRRKTGTKFRVPLLGEAMMIINEYGGIENLPFGIWGSHDTLNLLMKLAGINKTIRFHTARKTMANYLLNVLKVNPFYVKDIMGWIKIEESEVYTQVDVETLSHAMQLN